MSKPLPSNWLSLPLDEIALFNPKHSTDIEPSTPVSFVPMELVNENSWKLNLREDKPLNKVRKGYTHFADGDVLIAKITPSMENGKAAIAQGLTNGLGCGTTELHVLRPLADVEPKYIYFYIHQKMFRNKAARNMTGTAGQLRVPVDYLKSHPIPLPPLQEQHRIVTKLEELFTKLDAGIEELKEAKKQIKRYRQSVLKHAFTGKLTEKWREEHKDELEPASEILKRIQSSSFDTKNTPLPQVPENWSWTLLGSITDMFSGKAFKKNEYSDSGVRLFQIANVSFSRTLWDSVVYLPDEYLQTHEHLSLHAGEIVFALNRPILDNQLKIAILGEEDVPAILYQRVGCFNFHTEEMDKKFIFYYCQSPFFINKLRESLQGIDQPFINKPKLMNMMVPICSMKEQIQIINEIERHFSIADKAEQAIDQSLKQAERLRQSILKKAFEGRLVPQDPNDLPAPRPGKWFVYALECEGGSIYIGHTMDIENRWREHASGRGADWTRKHPPKHLVHWEEFDSQEAAVKRERDLKTGFGRKWLKREYVAGRTRQAGEPASVLLARIRAEKEKMKAKPKRTNRAIRKRAG